MLISIQSIQCRPPIPYTMRTSDWQNSYIYNHDSRAAACMINDSGTILNVINVRVFVKLELGRNNGFAMLSRGFD